MSRSLPRSSPGFLSFISPCVLPLIPGYVSFVSGVSLDDMRGGSAAVTSSRRHVLITSLFFVLGFSLVFIALGATASVLGKFLFARQPLLAKIAGVLLIVFGLHTMGVFRIGAAREREARPGPAEARGPARRDAGRHRVRVRMDAVHRSDPRRHPGDCRIEGHRARRASSCWRSTRSGLGIPFLLTSIAINQFFAATKRIRKHYHAIELVSGGLLVVIGVLIFTNQFTLIVRYLQPYLPVY